MQEDLEQLGNILREVRENKNFQLSEISSSLKIREYYLRQIEDGSFFKDESFPVYYLGYYKLYAEFLGLDSEHLLSKIKYSQNSHINTYLNNIPNKKIYPSKLLILLSIIIIFISYNLWSSFSFENLKFINHLSSLDINIKISDSNNFKLYKHLDNLDSNRVLLSSDFAQIRILDKNSQILISKALQPGDVYFLPNENGITILSNYPEVIEILENDKLVNLAEFSLNKLVDFDLITSMRYMPEFLNLND